MDAEKIVQDLNRRFAAPLPEFYNRRIIFWYDEDREFEDKLCEISLPDVKLARLTGSNSFAVKKLLTVDDKNSNYLVYSPVSYDKPDDNWLLNIELYSEEFRADLISIWMDEMGLADMPVIRKVVKTYRKFFDNKVRRAKVADFRGGITNGSQLHLAVMAVICKAKDMTPISIIREVIKAGVEKENNAVYPELVKYGADNPFWIMVKQATGYGEGDDSHLGRLAAHILLTAATRTIHEEYLAGLEPFYSIPHQPFCYDFVSEWLHGEDERHLYEVAGYVEQEVRLVQRFEQLTVEDLIDTECFPCIDECILTKLMTEISDNIIQAERITSAVEKRRTMVWYSEVSAFYDAIAQVANMQAFFQEHSAGFHSVEPAKIWEEYTTDYYRMDSYYRQFHQAFLRCLQFSDAELDDLIKHVADKVEGLYSVWFLGNLSENWTDACAEYMKEYGRVPDIMQQTDFYSEKIREAGSKIYVIISDAMRYEIAAALTEQLRRETQSKVELASCEAIFPTITKFGMAALLPHKELTIEEKTNGSLSVLADGEYTDSNYRDKVLKNENPASVALQYKNIIGMKRSERQALVKGMDVVYIYHDRIDEAAHTADTMVFPACEDAIDEIKNLVRIITNEFGGIYILITSDHGFLYTYSPLKEDGKVDKTSFAGQDVEFGRRYAIMRKGAKPDYLIPVSFLDGMSDYDAFTPRENIRIKTQGSGSNFVHGGISLQEMVVPVIEYRFLRNENKLYQKNKAKYDTKPVTVSLLSAGRKISNMIFSLSFYQKEPVGDNRSAATYLLYFVDASGKQISDMCKIIADKTGADSQDRTFRCNFNLKSLKYSNLESYYLMIADETGLQMPQREEFRIDIAFAVEEFDFSL
ncbi:MAG: BREX-1 system phosphatase PglZ type A [Clostridiales bacterium]|nr:BREX-1 system phosphatase PglZ type A [Clostridiales bacterium]